MVKKVRFATGFKRAALAVIGWSCFIAGVLINEALAKLALLAVARVLPQAHVASYA